MLMSVNVEVKMLNANDYHLQKLGVVFFCQIAIIGYQIKKRSKL